MFYLIIVLAVIATVVLFGVIFPIMFRRVVPTNMVHIVQTGKKTISHGSNKPAGNTYYQWPSWVPKLGVVVSQFPESIFDVNLKDYEAYDQARLPFVVDVTAFFRIEQSEMAAQRVSSFEELNQQLLTVLQGSIRTILANSPLEKIMESRAEFGEHFTKEVAEQLVNWGVVPVKTIELMDIRDSSKGQVIQNIMAKEKSRIEQESRVAVAENMRIAVEKEIIANREVALSQQQAEQQVGERTALKTREVGIANEKASQHIKAEAKVTAERDMEVVRVKQVREAEINRDTNVVIAEQDKSVMIINSEADKQNKIIVAQGVLEQAILNAKGIEAEGIAKGVAETAILRAPVDTQIMLAKEIGNNDGYQKYLVTIKQVEVSGEVGKELARAMEKADMKIIANSGDIQSGMSSLGDLFTAKGGTSIGAMLAALNNTEEGAALLNKLTPPSTKK